MRRAIKQIIKVLLMFALVMCFGLSIGYVNNIKNDKKVVNFYFEETELSVDMLKTIKGNKKDISMVGWVEKSLQSAYNQDFNRTINDLKVLLVDGNASLIINGPLLFEDDKEGCLLDEETAYKLFGSKHVIGKEITYEGRNLIVRGIHKGTKSNIVMQLLEDSRENMTGLSLDGTELSFNEIKDLRTSLGFKEMPISASTYYNFANIIMMIFPVLALVLIVIKVIVHAVRAKNKPILLFIYFCVIVVLGAVFLKITNIKVSIPLDIIPNKWSDFDFWSKLWSEYVEKLKYVMYMKKYGVDIYSIENLLMATLYSILTIVLFVINLKVIKINNIKELIVANLILVLSSFVVILLIWKNHSFDVNIAMIWAIYPLYLCADYFIKKHEKYLVYNENEDKSQNNGTNINSNEVMA